MEQKNENRQKAVKMVITIIAALAVAVVTAVITDGGISLVVTWMGLWLVSSMITLFAEGLAICFTDKDIKDILRIVCPAVLACISVILIIEESSHFMGSIGAGFIFWMATLPLIAMTVFRTIAGLIRFKKKYDKLKEQAGSKA